MEPKSFEMKPLDIAPKIAISGGVYLIPAEKVQTINKINYLSVIIYWEYTSSQATFEDAKALCKSRCMLLMNVDDKTESKDVSDFLKNAGLAAESFHCSKKEAPDSCNVMLNSQIQADSCDKKINFICEAKKYSNHPIYYIHIFKTK